MVESKAMFQSVGQAVAVSFIVLAQEARQPCATRKAMMRMMENEKTLTEEQGAWYDALSGEKRSDSAIDFGGLEANEIRAQCAMIVGAVRTKLKGNERAAVIARHASTEWEDVKGERRWAFSQEKSDAILELSGWLHGQFPNVPSMAMDCLAAKLYAGHSKTAIEYTELERNFGVSRMTFSRLANKIKPILRELEQSAEARLLPIFAESGICPAD